MCHSDIPEGTRTPSVAGREVAIPCADGNAMPGFLALPTTLPAPAVLIVSDALGRSGFYEHLARMLAEEGYIACAPDYFHRCKPLRDLEPETRRERRRLELDEMQVLRDLAGACDWLSGLPEVRGRPVGDIGFCMGGTLSLDLGLSWPNLRASVSFYGYPMGEPGKALVQPPRPLDVASKIATPVLGHWGDQDPAFDRAALEELERGLRPHAGTAIHVYPGIGHGFLRSFLDDPSAPEHAAAALSWQRTVQFLNDQLSA